MSGMQKFEEFTKHPIETIQGTIALTLSIFGIYILMPFYNPGTTTSAQTFGNSLTLRFIFCLVFFVLPALPTILGFWLSKFRSAKWRARGCMYMFVGIAFLTLLRILSVGVNPPIWFFYLGLGLVSAVLYLYWQVQT